METVAHPSMHVTAPKPIWRQGSENKIGEDGSRKLRNLNAKYREIDLYQIETVFPTISRLPQLKAVIDDLNWLCLGITQPEGSSYTAVVGKLSELQRDLERLKEAGYFVEEPEYYSKLVTALGEDRAREVILRG